MSRGAIDIFAEGGEERFGNFGRVVTVGERLAHHLDAALKFGLDGNIDTVGEKFGDMVVMGGAGDEREFGIGVASVFNG